MSSYVPFRGQRAYHRTFRWFLTLPPKELSFWHPAALIATWFGLGRMRFAPGTWGSLGGIPVAFAVEYLAYFRFQVSMDLSLLISTLALFFVGWWAADVYVKKSGIDDPSAVVVDEVVGQMVALLIVSWAWYPLITAGLKPRLPYRELWPFYLGFYFLAPFLSFLLFRAFDIWKPGPIGWCDRHIKGGFGVMFDDVLAGICAGLAAALLLYVMYHEMVHYSYVKYPYPHSLLMPKELQ